MEYSNLKWLVASIFFIIVSYVQKYIGFRFIKTPILLGGLFFIVFIVSIYKRYFKGTKPRKEV